MDKLRRLAQRQATTNQALIIRSPISSRLRRQIRRSSTHLDTSSQLTISNQHTTQLIGHRLLVLRLLARSLMHTPPPLLGLPGRILGLEILQATICR